MHSIYKKGAIYPRKRNSCGGHSPPSCLSVFLIGAVGGAIGGLAFLVGRDFNDYSSASFCFLIGPTEGFTVQLRAPLLDTSIFCIPTASADPATASLAQNGVGLASANGMLSVQSFSCTCPSNLYKSSLDMRTIGTHIVCCREW